MSNYQSVMSHFKEDKNITIIENEKNTGIINNPISIENEEESLENLEDFIIQQKKDFDHSSTLLIVEDDDELRKLLIEIFEPILKSMKQRMVKMHSKSHSSIHRILFYQM